MYGREYAELVIELVKAHEKQFREEQAERRRQSKPLGAKEPTPEQFAAWFEMKTAENPNWALALPFVDGGQALLDRYERARGVHYG